MGAKTSKNMDRRNNGQESMTAGGGYNTSNTYNQRLMEFERRKEMAMENERREDEEMKRDMDRRRKELDDSRRRFDMEMEQMNREDNYERNRRRQESNQHFLSLQYDMRDENERRNENSRKELDGYKQGLDKELNNMRKEDERRERQFEGYEEENRRRSMNRRRQYEEDREYKQREMENDRREYEDNKERIREESNRKQEEMKRKWRERREKADEQLREIQRMLQMKVWNHIIENNWANRLAFLRSANNEVERTHDYFNREAIRIQSEKSYKNIRNVNVELLKVRGNEVIMALVNEKKFLEKESENMSVMYRNTQKRFLLYIKESIDKVNKKCTILIDKISTFLGKLNEKWSESKLKEVRKAKYELSKTVQNIPTLSDLKRKHANDTKQNGPDDNTSYHTVIIEEID